MKTIINHNVKDTATIQAEEDLETRLKRLAATMFGFNPTNPTQRYFYSLKTTPYPNMTSELAFFNFQAGCKEYLKKRALGSQLDVMRESNHLAMSPTSVVKIPNQLFEMVQQESVVTDKIDKPIAIVAGVLEGSLSYDQAVARDLANILTVYSVAEEREVVENDKVVKRTTVTCLTQKQQAEGLLYTLDVESVRLSFPYLGASNIVTRDGMYQDLIADLSASGEDGPIKRNTQRAYLYKCMDELASKCDSFNVREFPEVCVECYNKFKHPSAPKKKTMKRFSYEAFRLVTGEQNHHKAWTTYLKCRQVTGGGKDNIFAGYSWLDLTPGALREYEQAMDIVTCARTFGFDAISVMQGNTVLNDLIVSAGLSVYCTSYGRGEQKPDDPVGIYYKGSCKTMTWFNAVQKSPEIKADNVVFPEPAQLYGANSFVYEYIPIQSSPGFNYLPSMKAAQGLCIKTNVSTVRFKCSIPELIERFFMATVARTQYIFTRITFPMCDPMAGFFKYSLVLARTKEGVAELVTFEELVKQSSTLKFNSAQKVKWEGGQITSSYLIAAPQDTPIDRKSLIARGSSQDMGGINDRFKKRVNFLLTNNKAFKVKDLFFSIASNLEVSDMELQECVSNLTRHRVLTELAVLGNFSAHQQIHGNGGVTFSNKKYWKTHLNQLDKAKPLEVPEVVSVVPIVPPETQISMFDLPPENIVIFKGRPWNPSEVID
jgi:hypothetical protein